MNKAAATSTSTGLCPAEPDLLIAGYEDAPRFAMSDERGRTILLLPPGRCHIFYIGDASPAQMIALLAEARAAGIDSVGDGVLFDFTRYAGILDWNYLADEPDVLPGMAEQPLKAAFLWTNDAGVILVRGYSHFVRGCECRAFVTYSEAKTWLGWE